MNDKEIIEEMAKESGGCDYPGRPCEKCWCKEERECSAYAYAEAYFNAGYRKIPDGLVVLTEMQYNALLSKQTTVISIDEQLKKEFEYELKQARKETAEKFYDKINENICVFKLENKSKEYKDGYAQAIADICGRLDQVAKQLGVEVEE